MGGWVDACAREERSLSGRKSRMRRESSNGRRCWSGLAGLKWLVSRARCTKYPTWGDDVCTSRFTLGEGHVHTQKQGKKEGMRLMKKKERKNRTIAAARQETTHKTARRGHVVRCCCSRHVWQLVKILLELSKNCCQKKGFCPGLVTWTDPNLQEVWEEMATWRSGGRSLRGVVRSAGKGHLSKLKKEGGEVVGEKWLCLPLLLLRWESFSNFNKF